MHLLCFFPNHANSMMKHISCKLLSLLFIIVAFYFDSSAQRLDSIANELQKYPQEKIYIQYDRPYYNPGETIWFKAYITSDNSTSSISKTVYAELLNDKGTILQKKTMPVMESGAASFFDIPDSLVAPVLYVRAYTNWMLNFDSTLLYYKPVRIISTSTKKATAIIPSYTLNFFPEGGDLINGIESLVAFKATDQSGNPIEITGNIIDKKGSKLVSFESVHNGMGTFAFKPSIDETYKAIWKDKKGVQHEAAFPAIKKQGVVLSVIKVNNNVTYTLKRTDPAEKAFTSFIVIGQVQQQVVYSAKINLSTKPEVTAAFPTDSLETGVVQLTVFNADEIPVAERIFFVNHGNYYFNTDLHAVELNLQPRKHNTLQIDVGGRIVSNLSIAVTDESLSTAPANRNNIYSDLLLSSDLKGYIYNPAYYFSSEEDSVAQQLNLVMLTNGWRRFKWEELIVGKWPSLNHQPENFISINGNVYGPSSTLLKGKEITGILKTKSSNDIYSMPVSPDGKFGLTGIAFFDTARLYYQFNQDKDKKLTGLSSFAFKVNYANPQGPGSLFLNSLYAPAMPDTSIAAKNKKLSKLIQLDFTESRKVKSLEAVVLKSKVKSREQLIDEKYTTGFFTRGDAHIFDIEGDPLARSSQTVLNYLQAKVAGLQITMSNPPKVSWRMSIPSFFLDESRSDVGQLQGINMGDVAMIKVFNPPFFNSMDGGAAGAIAVYLKKGGGESGMTTGLDFVRLTGYSPVKEFYSPDYEKLSDSVNVNDLRSTLYWNPFVILDADSRRIKIPFYNNDNCKKIRVIIEGINKEGKLTREEKVFE